MSCSSMVETFRRTPHGRLVRLALLGALLFASGAQAQESRFGRNRSTIANGPPASRPDCTCRAQGQNFHVGTETCLHVNGISQIFRCDMDLNVTSWKPVGSLCPLS